MGSELEMYVHIAVVYPSSCISCMEVHCFNLLLMNILTALLRSTTIDAISILIVIVYCKNNSYIDNNHLIVYIVVGYLNTWHLVLE